MALTQLLIVEDNPDVAGILADFFESKGAVVDFATNGELGYKLALEGSFDLIILDLMLPKMDGLTVAKQLRHMGCNTPVLMLTALNDKQDLLKGFASGADDYLAKPFDLDELNARVTALINRHHGKVARGVLKFGSLELDIAKHEVYRSGKKLALTPTCYQILHHLMHKAPNIVKREELIEALWSDTPPSNDILRSHMYQLRNQLDKPFDSPILTTVPKIGFKLELTSN
ncbi:response regulator transcription factor [Shewanella woodyi]|uniref:Two component transcriptional regulator, winged helix family n=1 Tax=Shewanella woodyi (strain ATCC 51908 / MS32) TaxID=392500 RepID=B1KIL2_SHEWM|nr:response regulator transcription factor [Shewanella woodyi]ACA88508.1 two component transcriptional regulator, winged helix family [Shewanella woodyi ATCC 51908]